MRIIISPAKKMNVDTESFACEALPQFLPKTEQLYERLRGMSYEELKALWKCNDQLARLNVERLAAMGGIAPGNRFLGLVVSEHTAEISRDADKTIQELLVKEGDDVKEGQALFSYDTEELQLNLDKKTVSIDGEAIPFTKTEFELLRLFLEERGKVFSRQELIDRVWPKDVMVLDRTVDVNITRMRKKIGKFAKCIVTRLGFGYYFDA